MREDLLSKPSPTLSVDWGGIRSARLRAEVRRAVESLGESFSAQDHLWHDFLFGQPGPVPQRFLVVTDLGSCARDFRSSDVRRWTSAIRTARPYILALIRGEADRRYADVVDDIVQASENRVSVHALKDDPTALPRFLGRGLFSTDPGAILEVRYSPAEHRLWFCFGDGKNASLLWDELGIPEGSLPLRPATASVSEGHDSVEVLRLDGSVFEIDSVALRAMVDRWAGRRLEAAAIRSNQQLGKLLREKRKRRALTQVEVAKRSGLEQSLISKLENGRHRPRFDTLRRYTRALGMTVAEALEPSGIGGSRDLPDDSSNFRHPS